MGAVPFAFPELVGGGGDEGETTPGGSFRSALKRFERIGAAVRQRASEVVSVQLPSAQREALNGPLRRALMVIEDVRLELESAAVAWEMEIDVEP